MDTFIGDFLNAAVHYVFKSLSVQYWTQLTAMRVEPPPTFLLYLLSSFV